MSLKHTSTDGLSGNTKPLHFKVTAVDVTASTGTVVLVAAQYESPILTVTGAMAGNTVLEIPNTLGGQLIVNNEATGAFTLKIKTAGGTAVQLLTGVNVIEVGTTLLARNVKKSRGTMALADANTTLVITDVLLYDFMEFTGTLTAGRDLNLPTCYLGQIVFKNSTGQTLSVKLGATTITQATGVTKIFYVTPTTLEAIT